MHKLNNISSVINKTRSLIPKTRDIRDLGAEITGYFNHSMVPINILMLMDNSADPEISACIRNLFMTKSINVKLQISYYSKDIDTLDESADMAIIVSGKDVSGFDVAQACREKMVPCCVIMQSGSKKADTSKISKSFDGDIFYLDCVDKDSVKKIKQKLGAWIAVVCSSKKFAYSKAFPFVAGPIANEIVHLTSVENAAITAVPYISGADFPLMLINQMKMLAQIAAVYGIKLDYSLIKEAAGVMVFAIFGKKCFKIIHKILPVPRIFIAAPVTIATTEAIGMSLIAYFDAGGNAEGLLALLQKSAFGAGAIKNATSPALKTLLNLLNKK